MSTPIPTRAPSALTTRAGGTTISARRGENALAPPPDQPVNDPPASKMCTHHQPAREQDVHTHHQPARRVARVAAPRRLPAVPLATRLAPHLLQPTGHQATPHSPRHKYVRYCAGDPQATTPRIHRRFRRVLHGCGDGIRRQPHASLISPHTNHTITASMHTARPQPTPADATPGAATGDGAGNSFATLARPAPMFCVTHYLRCTYTALNTAPLRADGTSARILHAKIA